MMTRFTQSLQKLGILGPIIAGLRRLGLLRAAYRAYEQVVALSERRSGSQPVAAPDNDLPLPPAELMVLVAGTADVGWFLRFGRSMFEVILQTLEKNGVRPASLSDVLEFGCGCGRVLRYWGAVSGPRIYGVDYNRRLVDWCRRNLLFAQVTANELAPPIAFADETFDCVYAISVFTHMAEQLQLDWMRELRRVVRPGGYLLLTAHGQSYRERLTPKERAVFDSGRLVVRYDEASGMNLCSAYHPLAYVRGRLSAGYTVADFIPAGTHGVLYQDLYLLRRD